MGVAAALLLGGCETTGDPRQGALFGWSEAKARDRQALLRQQLDEANADNRSASARSSSLRAAQSSLRTDVSARSARLSALEGRVANLQQASASGLTTPSETRQQATLLEKEISSQDASDPQMQEMLGRLKDLAR
jgi:chromosome segregation ATPase